MHLTVTHISLASTFNHLGVHLFGSQWDGYEILGRKSFDYKPIIEVRKPLEERLEDSFITLREQQSELRNTLSKEDIQRVNNDISNLKDEQSKLHADLYEIGEIEKYDIIDRDRWERFETTEGLLLRAFRNSDLTVQCFLAMNVNQNLWTEMPKGFGYDWELSLVMLPEPESSKRVSAAHVDTKEFESWLYSITPEHSDAATTLPIEQQAQMWLREEIKIWDGLEKRDSFMERAVQKFPDLAGRAFKRIWDSEATKKMKAPGPKIV